MIERTRVRLVLALLVVAGFLLRTVPRWRETFPDGGLRLADPDGWHHLRQVEQWARHFPERMRFDPYALHPGGMDVPVAPLFDGVCAAVAFVLGGPDAAPRVVAIVPAVCGALLCLPAFVLGRRLGGTAGGLVAALIAATLPGQLLVRTMLGFADHHAIEALLAAVAVALLASSLARPDDDDRAALRLAALAGVALGLHQLSWTGGALLVAALAVAGVAVAVADAVRARPLSPTLARVTTALGVALIVFVPFASSTPTGTVHAAALGGATVAVAATVAVLGLCRQGGVRPWLAAAAAFSLHVVGAGVTVLLSPTVASTVLAAVGWLSPSAERATVAEARPFFLGESGWTIAPAWFEFGVPGLVAVVGGVVLAVRIYRQGRRDEGFLATVFAGGVLLAFAQIRFVPYAGFAAAALAGLALGPWLGRAWRGEVADTPRWLARAVWPIAISIALVVPTWPFAWAVVQAPGTPREPWADVLRFLREKTPEPFGDAAAFERIVPRPAPGAAAEEPTYGVLAWWDAGYWITQIARRVPLANPTQAGAGDVARFLLEQDPALAAWRAGDLGARYVVLDAEMLVLPRGGALRGTLPSVAPWAGVDPDELVLSFRDRRPGAPDPEIVLFLPAYYRSTFCRLFLFAGREATEGSVLGVAWRPGEDGVREVVETRRFETFDEADAWARAQPGGRACVGSTDAVSSCVPLEASPGFRLVGRSSTAAPILSFTPIWNAQVWERVDD